MVSAPRKQAVLIENVLIGNHTPPPLVDSLIGVQCSSWNRSPADRQSRRQMDDPRDRCGGFEGRARPGDTHPQVTEDI